MTDESDWGVLTPEQRRILGGSVSWQTYRSGERIFEQGTACHGLHVVDSGEVALRKTDDRGHSAIVRLAHAGQPLGYRAFFSSEPYAASAEALTQARVGFVERDVVDRLLADDPSLGLRFLKHVAEDLRESEEARLQVASLPVRARVAHLLVTLKDRHGRMGEDGVLAILLPLSRQDMAAAVGTRPETIARTIRALEQDGVAIFDGRTVRIPDLDTLLDEIERAFEP